MSSSAAIPESFRALVAEREGDSVRSEVGSLRTADLPPGDVTIRIEWSSVNYKDALAILADGKVARIDRLVPGIDLAGKVVASDAPDFAVGTAVLAHGYEIGVARHGGYAAYARVPNEWVVPLPAGLTAHDAMAIGTAGFTAALAVKRMERWGLRTTSGPVLVTGATGGVGRMAVDILAGRGYEVWAATGKPDADEELRDLGAAGILTREEVSGPGRPIDRQRWAGAVDPVGGSTLPYVLRTMRYGGIVAACGTVGGTGIETTVFPFILRAVTLAGIDSVDVHIEERRELWAQLASEMRPRHLDAGLKEVDLDGLGTALAEMSAGAARGRTVVRLGA